MEMVNEIRVTSDLIINSGTSAENELEAETVWYIVSKTWRLAATVEKQFERMEV